MENKYYHYDVRKLMKLDPSDPIFDHIKKQRIPTLQVHSLTGYQIVSNYYNAILAENLIRNVILNERGYLFGNLNTYSDAKFFDHDRNFFTVSADDTPVKTRNNEADILVSTIFTDQRIEVKCMCIDKEEAFNQYHNNIWNPFHKYFKGVDHGDIEENWRRFCNYYTHNADVVVVVPVKDGKLADKDYGAFYFHPNTASYTMKEFPQGNGFRFYVQGTHLESYVFRMHESLKYKE